MSPWGLKPEEVGRLLYVPLSLRNGLVQVSVYMTMSSKWNSHYHLHQNLHEYLPESPKAYLLSIELSS